MLAHQAGLLHQRASCLRDLSRTVMPGDKETEGAATQEESDGSYMVDARRRYLMVKIHDPIVTLGWETYSVTSIDPLKREMPAYQAKFQ